MQLNISSPPSDRDLREYALAAAGTVVFMLLFFIECKVYDLLTAAAFALCIGLMARGKLIPYLVVFAVANINRETMVLLVPVFAVYFFRKMDWRKYTGLILLQLVIALGIRFAITTLYAGNPGTDMIIWPVANLARFINAPLFSIVHWSGFTVIVWLVVRRWSGAPRILQVSILVLTPLIMVLYLFAGMAYEIRVFAEVFPVVWAMIWR